MEVSGRPADNNQEGEMSESQLICVPCKHDGSHVSAFGYCQNCHEHLCKTCFNNHAKSRLLRHHILLDTLKMPKTLHHGHLTDDADVCTSHRNKHIKFYCTNHDAVLCSVCVTLHHRECKIDYIPDVADTVIKNSSVDILLSDLEEFMLQCRSDIENADKHVSNVASRRAELLEELKLFRAEVNSVLDDIEKDVMKETKTQSDKEKRNMEHLKTGTEDILTEVELSISKLKSLKAQNKTCKLFVCFIRTKQLQNYLKLKQGKNVAVPRKMIAFHKNLKILTDIKREKLGSVVTSPASITIVEQKEMSGLPEDCEWISGLAHISSTEMIVTAYSSQQAMLINVREDSLVSELKFCEEGPYDVACLPSTLVAVTFIETCEIRFLSYACKTLTEVECLRVDFQCFGIAYHDNKLIVTSCLYTCDLWQDGKIYILTMQGQTLTYFDDSSMFDIPNYIEVSRDGKSMLVADSKAHSVLKLDWSGQVMNMFKMDGYKEPSGIQELEDGTIVVCFEDAHKILRLTKDLELSDVLVSNSDVCHPLALSYCKDTRRLYGSCVLRKKRSVCFADGVKMFRLEWHKP